MNTTLLVLSIVCIIVAVFADQGEARAMFRFPWEA
jgi:hypothetical protein